MDNTAKIAIGGTLLGVGGYLAYDHFSKKNEPGASGQTLLDSAIGAARNVVPSLNGPNTRSVVSTPYPGMNAAASMAGSFETHGRSYIEGARGSVNLMGVQSMWLDINGGGGQQIVAGLTSCETMTGSLRLACWNGNLMNFHSTDSQNNVVLGRERIIDFLYGKPSQVVAFQDCLNYFKEWINRHCPNAMVPLTENNFEEFTLRWATAWGATSYKNDIVNGSVPRSTLRARYNRLVENRLVL